MGSSNAMAIKIFLIATIFGCAAVTQTRCFDFNFSSFDDSSRSQLNLRGDSNILLKAIQVTFDVQGAPITHLSGRAVYYKKFKLRNKDKIASFNTTFVLNISNRTQVGGEGLAFILSADASVPADSDGKWLGMVSPSTNGTAKAAIIAVEFDTRKSFPEDIDSNHVGLNVNSIFSNNQSSLWKFGVDLLSGSDVFGMIRYDGENISIYASNNTDHLLKNLIIFQKLDLSVLPDDVYVGFSGSTSNYTQLNCVKSWQFYGTDVGDRVKKHLWIRITVPAVVFVLVFLCGVGFLFYRKRNRQLINSQDAYNGIENQLQNFSIAKKFKLTELRKATGNFNPKNRLGRGGFGTVFKGILMNKEVAVKTLSKDSRQGKNEFIAEVTTIGSLHHKNLVKLIGWCYEKMELLLVYEYMPNGSLDKLLFGDDKVGAMDSSPNWKTRNNIIFGVAEALDYLHNGCEKTVLHRDVKSSNIMLDSKLEAKLGDFGLARAFNRTEQTHHSTRDIAGTPGYMAPETILTSRATPETDVYAFGILVLEVVCGRKPGNPYDELGGGYDGSIAHWAWEYHKKGKIVEVVDERIGGEYVEEEMEDLLILGLACCHPNPHQRPTMKNVLQVIKGETNPPILPSERPSFVWPPMPPSFKEDPENSLRESNLTPFTELTGR